jgi:hypothetical protein
MGKRYTEPLTRSHVIFPILVVVKYRHTRPATCEGHPIIAPQRPPLNGRNLAEFYVATETAKRTTLREYAKPPEQQQARIIMYDPMRRILVEYFGAGRNIEVIERARSLVEQPRFVNADYYEKWRKSNQNALAHLQEIDLGGTFNDVRAAKASVSVGEVVVNSTVDFYATFMPSAKNAKPRRVAVIVNPSGIKLSSVEKRKTWIDIEGEVARHAAADRGFEIDEVIYIDLPKREAHRLRGGKARVWSEITATCERILRDWRDIRLDQSQSQSGRA